ncbi:hypothetical protein DRQ33_04295 [bacterium]|nr:MAG: hypothetical protein DRQ33_04295 [bacterium]
MKWKKIIIMVCVIGLVNIIFGQEKSKNTQKVTPDLFVELYVELSIAAEQFLEDSAKLVQVQDSIFDSFNVTRQSFDEFRQEMDKEPEKWNDIWKQIVDKLEEKDRLDKKSPVESEEKKTNKNPELNSEGEDE